jgi:hypothetical protein
MKQIGRNWYRAGLVLLLAMTVSPILASITDDIDPKRFTIAIDAGQFSVTTGFARVTAIVDGQTVTAEGTYTVSGNQLTVEVALDGKDVQIVDVKVEE